MSFCRMAIGSVLLALIADRASAQVLDSIGDTTKPAATAAQAGESIPAPPAAVSPVPEPTSLLLLASPAAVGWVVYWRRRWRATPLAGPTRTSSDLTGGVLVAIGALSYLITAPIAVDAQSWVPTAVGAYNWNDSANWTPGPFPNSTAAVAVLPNTTTNNQTVNLNQVISVNQLTLGGPSSFTVALGTGGGLTFAGATPGLTVTAGSVAQAVSAAVSMSAAMTITQNSTTAPLTVSGTLINGGFLLTVTGAGDTALTNIVSGAGGVTKTGTGTLTLAGTNTYTGVTTVTAGTLQIGNGGTTGTVVGNVSDNAALVFNRSDSLTYAGVVNGAGTVTKFGTGTLTLTATNTYSGGTTVSAGTLQVGAGGTVGSLSNNNVAVAASGTLAFNRSDSYTFGGVISGAGNLIQLGSGTLIMSGANTINGTATINAGTLQLGSGSTNGTVGGPIVDNGSLAVNRSNALTLSGAISGTGGLTKLGAGTLTLSGVNSYSGVTTISGGGILFNAATALGSGAAASMTIASGGFAAANYAIDQAFLTRVSGASAGVVALNAGSTINLDFSTPGLTNVSLGATATATYSGTLTPGGATYRLGGGGGTLTVSSNLTGANALVVNNNGTANAIVVLSGTNNYTGVTTVSNGTLRYSTAASMTLGAASVTVASGAIVAAGYAIDQTFLNRINGSSAGVVALNFSSNNSLDFNTPGLTNVSLGTTASFAYGNALTVLTPAGNTFRFGGGGSGALTVNALLTGPTNAVVIGGNGTVSGTVIFGAAANTYGGSTTVTAGTLQFNSALTIGGLGASVTVNAGATASTNYAMDQAFLNRVNSASAGVVAIAVVSSNDLDFNSPGLSGVSFGAKSALTYSGNLTPHGTTFRLGGGGGALTVSSNLTGAGNAVVVRDAGNLILAGNNSFGAGLSTDSAHPDTGIVVTNVNGLSTGNVTFANGTVNSSASAPVLGFDLGASSSTTVSNNIALDGSTVLKDFSIQSNNSQTVNLSGLVSGGSAGGSVQFTNATNGHTGAFVLSNAANSFLGTVEIVQGTLAVSTDAVLGNAANAIKLSLNTGVAGGFQFTTGFASARGVIVNKDSRIVQADAVNPATLSGVVSGSGVTLFKAGAGTLTLSNVTNTFSGNFSVDTGTLVLTSGNNSVASTTVNTGATLQVGIGGTVGSLGGNMTNLAAVFFNRSDVATYSGAIGGGGSVTQQGTGTLTLSGTNGSTGAYAVAAGILTLTGANNSVAGTSVAPGTTLIVGGGAGTLGGNIANNGTTTFNRSTAYTFGGAISGAGGVSQQGGNTLTLSGVSSYSGPTTVSAGTLALSGTLGNTAVSIGTGAAASGTLSGTGTVGGGLAVHAGGAVAPGDGGFGTLTVGSLTVEGGVTLNGPHGTLAARLGPTATDHDLLATGLLNFVGTGFAERPSVALSPLSGGPAGATTFVIADLGLGNGANLLYNGVTVPDGTILGFSTVGGASTGLVNIVATGFPTGNQFTLSRSTEYVIVSYSPVPEPTATFTMCGGHWPLPAGGTAAGHVSRLKAPRYES